ncbi:MAG: hypothetical protein GC168_20835 [Candidatus Hydrogenedens sp.]|nr:hypothetical protein [Candidatus Hydrogenedens sp.]
MKKYLYSASLLAAFVSMLLVPARPAEAHGFLHGDSPYRFGISMYIARPLRVGVTLPVYESWLHNIVFERSEILSFSRADLEPKDDAAWQATLDKLRAVDLFVVCEHPDDEYIDALLTKADMMYQVPLIYADLGAAPLVHAFDVPEGRVTPRPFLALTSAAQQMFTMSNALARMDPANNLDIRRNVSAYTATLSEAKRKLVQSVAHWSGEELYVLSLEGGYEYLLEEVGLTPLPPPADAEALFDNPAGLKALADTHAIDIVTTTRPVDDAAAKAVREACGAELIQLDPIAMVDGTANSFGAYWQRNLEHLLALRTRLLEARHPGGKP